MISDRVIRVRNLDDMEQQITMHRHNVLAAAILLDVHHVPLTAAGGQKHPISRAILEGFHVGHVDPKDARTSAAGSELAFRLSKAETRLSELDSAIITAGQQENQSRVDYLTGVKQGVAERARKLRKVLAEVDVDVRTPKGLPHLYEARVAPLGTTGWLESCRADERWVLDTTELGTTTKKRLDRYLKSNTRDALPYRFVESKLRYQASDRPAEDRDLMLSLWRHVKRGETLISPSLAQLPLRNAQ